jgi:hypothetical protein
MIYKEISEREITFDYLAPGDFFIPANSDEGLFLKVDSLRAINFNSSTLEDIRSCICDLVLFGNCIPSYTCVYPINYIIRNPVGVFVLTQSLVVGVMINRDYTFRFDDKRIHKTDDLRPIIPLEKVCFGKGILVKSNRGGE